MRNKIFLDTNIFLRFFINDNENKFLDCVKLFQKIKEGLITPYTSNVVFIEFLYTAIRFYKFSKKATLKAVDRILKMRNLTIIERTNTKKALEFFKLYNIKYGDCLIATQIPEKAILCSYDEDFIKIPHLKVKNPSQILSS